MNSTSFIIKFGLILLLNGCVGHRGLNTRDVANSLDLIPLNTKLEISEGCLVAEGCPDFNALKLESINTSALKYSQKVDELILERVLCMSPEFRFFRIFPDNLFFTLEEDDVYYGFDVSVPFNQWDQGILVFLSSDYKYKGYYGYNNLPSTKDSKARRERSENVFYSEDMKYLRSQLEWLDELNKKNLKKGVRYTIFPELPLIPKSNSQDLRSFESIKGRKGFGRFGDIGGAGKVNASKER